MSWTSLLKKEWKASSTMFGIGLLALLTIYLLIYFGMGHYSPFLLLLAFAAIFAHLLAVGLDLLGSLRKEWKENTVYIWMNLPLPGWQLLLSKLLITFIQFVVSLLITLVFTYIFINRAIDLFQQRVNGQEHAIAMETVRSTFIEMVPYFLLVIPFISVLLALGVAFIFLMSKVTRPFGGVIGAVLIGGFFYGYILLIHTNLFATMTHWGFIRNFAFPEQIMFQGGSETAIDVGQEILHPLYIGQIFFGVVVLFGMFVLLSWLLDRKVQVG
ncbi:hypothetical protein QA612_06060 [Evansella sp. AB-P1]|uniref:hypothetical protein n=1 Tax=Evansella sp. AB-P1 TaxID=3037653 RepID=UPI00241FF7C8|nr:hypothetical protein [Evansella sp. AB-P1]MDG5787050.1 hypothetical protein [Evansella sp. AB-P1]